MFAHQVIEDCQKEIKSGVTPDYEREANKAISLIRKSAKFHMGDLDNVFDVFKGKNTADCFSRDTKYMKLPYLTTWFDYTHKRIFPGDAPNTKEGVLIQTTGGQQWTVYTATYHQVSKKWLLYPHKCKIDIAEGGSMVTPNFFLGGKANKDLEARFLKEFAWVVVLIDYSVRLLNCKNIFAEKIPAPEALNKKRRRAGKQELFDYHVLNVVVPPKKRGYHVSTEPLSHNRVHLCRGHFKEYTVEHPLFGHYTGLFWWQPHVRGQNKDGIVMKDYNIHRKGWREPRVCWERGTNG